MFHFDDGLKLTAIDLAIDFQRRQPRGFISHAHADHMARHELAYCTPATARLYQHRLGPRRTVEMPYGLTLPCGPIRLTTYPAGHVLGSAMLLADDGHRSLLYTGDFQLGDAATAEKAEPPRADTLVMECTFGDPRYRMPPRAEVAARLLQLVREALASGVTPVVHAYVLGKAQEVTRLFTQAGLGVLQHPLIHSISLVYEACGCPLGDFALYHPDRLPGRVVIVPPRAQAAACLPLPERVQRIAVTGWAMNQGSERRLQVDRALPLSDHADFDQLLRLPQIVQPRVIYCTHGPAAFVARLRRAGFDARPLQPIAAPRPRRAASVGRPFPATERP